MTGRNGRGPRRTSRGLIPDLWLICVARADIDSGTRALMIAMYSRMTPTGRVSVKRSELAEEFDTTLGTISNRISDAVQAQLIRKVGGGYPTRAAEYEAIIPAGMDAGAVSDFWRDYVAESGEWFTQWVHQKVHHSESEKSEDAENMVHPVGASTARVTKATTTAQRNRDHHLPAADDQ